MDKTVYVFVHGLSGWGSYDSHHRRMPYWGMRNGDLMRYLRKKGYDSYAASVSPGGSAWDRTCELYAQIAGTVTDYGKVHSEKNGHQRFGRDYSGQPLIPSWNGDTRLVLIGHSFGGTTIRLFTSLLKNGSEEEREGTEPGELSPLFKGGMAERIHSVVTIASPINGTSIYDMLNDPDFDHEKVKSPWWSKILARMSVKKVHTKTRDRARSDYADHEMHIDNALELNKKIETLQDVYYFSIPISCCKMLPDGTFSPQKAEPFLVRPSGKLGAYSGYTKGGFRIDESWRDNDGLVNTVSAKAPFNAESKQFEKDNIKKGIWNVFPVIKGDHVWPQGGMFYRRNIKNFYTELLEMINALEN